jgi:peptide/nickel transport system permease protein
MARRVLWGIGVIVLVALTVFVVSRVGSDPARQLVPPDATQEQYETVKNRLGLDNSVPAQLWAYVGQLVRGDLGVSYWRDAAVGDLIRERLPNTLLLVALAMTVATLFGVFIGVIASLRPGSALEQILAATSLVALSIPQFFLGTVLILIFAVELGWLPTQGQGGISHAILPTLTLALPCMGRIAQITRATMIDELATHHVLVARAKGLKGTYIVMRHALRNVLVPIVTLCGYETAYALAGYSVIVETVFSWPGIGYLTIQAIERQDLIVVQGVVLVIAAIVVLVNIVTDLTYKVIDPRVEFG